MSSTINTIHAIHSQLSPFYDAWFAQLPTPLLTTTAHAVYNATNLLSALLLQYSQPSLSQWLIQIWTNLYSNKSRHRPSTSNPVFLFDVIWVAWATSPALNIAKPSTSVYNSPLAVVVEALSKFNSECADPDRMPWRALVLLVDHTVPSPIRSLLTIPVLRPEPLMIQSNAPQNQPSRKRGYNGNQRDLDPEPQIPPMMDPILTYTLPTSLTSTLTVLFSLLLYCDDLDCVRDKMLDCVTDQKVAVSLLHAFVSWTVSVDQLNRKSMLDQTKYAKLTLAISKNPKVYLRYPTLPALTRALLGTIPMHVLTSPILLPNAQSIHPTTPADIIQAYFSLPVNHVVPRALFNTINLSPQDLLLLMLALAHVNSTKDTNNSIWLHHILIPVLDSLSIPSSMSSNQITPWSVMCHFLDTPVLACAFLIQLRLRGPLFDALVSAIASTSQISSDNAEDLSECAPTPTFNEKESLGIYSLPSNGLQFIHAWESRWTAPGVSLDPDVLLDLAQVDFVNKTHQASPAVLQPLMQLQSQVLSSQVACHVSHHLHLDRPGNLLLVQELVSTLLSSPFPAGNLISAVIRGVESHGLPSLANGLDRFCRESMELPEYMSRFVANLTSVPINEPLSNQSLALADDEYLVVRGMVAMHFSSDHIFGFVIYQVFHLMPNDLALCYLDWLSKLIDCARLRLPSWNCSDLIDVHFSTVSAALLYTAHSNGDVAKAIARVLESLGQLVLLNIQHLHGIQNSTQVSHPSSSSSPSTSLVATAHPEMLDALLKHFFDEFDRLSVKREKTELLNAVANQPLDSFTSLGRPLLPLDPRQLIDISIDPSQVPEILHTPEGAAMHAIAEDWAQAQTVLAAAVRRSHARLDHLTQGFTHIAQSWHFHNSTCAEAREARIVTEVLTRMDMFGHTEDLAAVSQWHFPNPYLMHVLVRIGLGPAFLKAAGVQLAGELLQTGSSSDDNNPVVPASIIDDTFRAVYLMATGAFMEHRQGKGKNDLPFDYALLVALLASVLKVSESLYPAWHQLVSALPVIQNVTRDMYAPLVQAVLLPVEHLTSDSLWWCSVEGIIRRKIPAPRG